ETLIDTAKTIESMGIDFAVVRHSSSGAPHFLAQRIKAHVLNGGDGAHEHPTQALLDLLTMKEALGRVSKLHIVLVGDITHSRVARSNIWALQTLGNKVTVVGPPTLLPRGLRAHGVTVTYDFDRVLRKADVVMMLRLQKERQGEHLIPSPTEYTRFFGLTPERFAMLPKKAIVMHPGPMVRGLEISGAAADSKRSVILHQVKNGIFVRMAVLLLLAGVKS
ncbi:MAG: aspartate carbamoyltransferase catalytic subunit, partial [Planctomycetota bacterium]